MTCKLEQVGDFGDQGMQERPGCQVGQAPGADHYGAVPVSKVVLMQLVEGFLAVHNEQVPACACSAIQRRLPRTNCNQFMTSTCPGGQAFSQSCGLKVESSSAAAIPDGDDLPPAGAVQQRYTCRRPEEHLEVPKDGAPASTAENAISWHACMHACICKRIVQGLHSSLVGHQLC